VEKEKEEEEDVGGWEGRGKTLILANKKRKNSRRKKEGGRESRLAEALRNSLHKGNGKREWPILGGKIGAWQGGQKVLCLAKKSH